MMAPGKELFLRNIYTLAKEKGVRIGDLETRCGVSVGYLARFRQDKKQDLPGMEFVIRAAAVLDTSLDFLLFFDYALASENEKYLARFIGRLSADTAVDRLLWQPDPGCFPLRSEITSDTPLHPDHPLIMYDQDLVLKGIYKEHYHSPFHPRAKNLYPLAAWRASISDTSDVLLVRITREPSETDERDNAAEKQAEAWEELELYILNNENDLDTLCHTNMSVNGILDESLKHLFRSVELFLRPQAPADWTRTAIDNYMSSRTGM